MSHVYWLTGLSGAGKTTIGKLWYELLRREKPNVVLLDGDKLREVFGDGMGYTESDRRRIAMRYARLCAMLAEQNIDVVCCTISMFHSVREWNRQHIPGYVEIYIRVRMETLIARDQKGLYSSVEKNVAGVHFTVEKPEHPDIILDNDGEISPQGQVDILRKHLM